MKKTINKIINRLVMKQRNPWVERNIINPLVVFLLFLSNEEFKWTRFTKLFLKNKTTLIILVVFTLFMIGSYRAGKENSFSIIEYLSFKLKGSYTNIVALNSDIYNKTNTIEDLSAFFSSREYMKYKAYSEAKILIPEWFPTKHLQLMIDEANKYSVPLKIVFRVAWKENRFKSKTVSSAGAKGYMQVMPATFKVQSKKLGLVGGHTPENNIKAAIYLLHTLYEKWNKKYSSDKAWDLALSEYNAGIVSVLEANENVPNIKETKNYVNFVNS